MSQEYDSIHVSEITCEYAWEEERQPSSERGGWEPYWFAALHTYHKYSRYIVNDIENREVHIKAIDNAILNLTKALTSAITKKEYSPASIFGSADIAHIRSSFQTFPSLYPERETHLYLPQNLFEIYSSINLSNVQSKFEKDFIK